MKKYTHEKAHEEIDYIFKTLLPQRGMAERPEQIRLCHSILDAMLDGSIALCDAGTGIGKTFAYLTAGILHGKCRAAEGKPQRPILISTSSIALQSAIQKEYLPLLSSVLLSEGLISAPIEAVIRKGKAHYACDARLERRVRQVEGSHKNPAARQALHTAWHVLDLDQLSGMSSYDRERICVPKRCNCRRKDCRYRCFLDACQSGQYTVQICNHNLLLADLIHRSQKKKSILPDSAAIIIDEAHKLPETARQMFGVTLNAQDFAELIRSLHVERYVLAAELLSEAVEPLAEKLSLPVEEGAGFDAYTEAAGHKPGDWIIDKEPTTDSEGSQHKECEVCGETLETEEIEKIYNQATTDSKGEAVVGGYLVIVTDTDTKDPVANATVTLHADDTLSIRLPNSRILDYADQTTVTVLLTKDKSAVADLFISVTDKHNNYCAGNTDSNGQVTVPGTSGKTNEDGNATVGWEDEDGDRWTLTVTVEDYETGRPIEDAEVSIGKGGNITVTLPDGTDMDEDNRITVTVTDNERDPQEDVTVIVKGDLGQRETGETDEDGKLTVPAVTETEYHGAYIVGYTDGTFGPERSMSRSEAAAIFARLLSDKLDERIPSGNNVKFKDIDPDMWYAGYVEYLTGYGVAVGYNDRTYRGDKAITRAEFTAMAARFFDVYGDGAEEIMEQYEGFDDVSDGYWAAEYIKDAAIHGWVSRMPTTSVTSSSSWSTRDMRSSMAPVSVSVCGAKSGSWCRAGRIRCSPRTASAPPSMGTWTRLPLAIVRRLSTGPGMSRTAGASPRSIPDLWPCTSTTSICWARPGSGSIRRR